MSVIHGVDLRSFPQLRGTANYIKVLTVAPAKLFRTKYLALPTLGTHLTQSNVREGTGAIHVSTRIVAQRPIRMPSIPSQVYPSHSDDLVHRSTKTIDQKTWPLERGTDQPRDRLSDKRTNRPTDRLTFVSAMADSSLAFCASQGPSAATNAARMCSVRSSSEFCRKIIGTTAPEKLTPRYRLRRLVRKVRASEATWCPKLNG